MIVNLNGTLQQANIASINPEDRGLTLGDGIFETLLVMDGRIPRLSLHMRRLQSGAKLLGLTLPGDIDLSKWLYATVNANSLVSGTLRLTLTRGPSQRGLVPTSFKTPTVLITVSSFLPVFRSVHAVIVTTIRRNQYSPLSRIKSLNALDNILACKEAMERGADEALILNTAGRLAETATANLFLVVGGVLLTPSITEGALPGIMRSAILASQTRKLQVIETALLPVDLFHATEVFITNTLSIRHLISVNGHLLGNTLQIQKVITKLFLSL